ncbi:bifunctional metallophosphatase/5'-nucleotidase [Gorillibacterium sp. sgz5001074]|uniref:bifunctional metallophosphatase/5'-nucleotidase n=1 Tax=Gorillibacterium sp. sgz5001074 TaxID=3446695 RepID=UPI003F676A85
MSGASRKVVLIHTSDIHSAFREMPHVAGAMDRIRAEWRGTPILTADCGDHLDRMSLLTEGTGGEAHIRVLEAAGYDVVTLGNNEGLTLPKHRVDELYGRPLPFGVVCANLKDASTGRPPAWMEPHRIVEREGIRIGFIGATARYPIFYRLLGWMVEEPMEAVRCQVEAIREQSDIVVLLSHLGLSADQRIAGEIAGIDVILGGHTHHVLEAPLRVGNTYLFGCGLLGKYVGEAVLSVDPVTKRFSHAEGRLHRTDEAPASEALRHLIGSITGESQEAMNRPAAVLTSELPVDWERDSPFGNLLAAGLRKWTGAQIGLINSGQLLQSLRAGTVTKGTLLELCPSPINPCLIRLPGYALLSALEQSLQDDFVKMTVYGNGFRGKYLGGLCVDGMEIRWDPSLPAGARITSASAGGVPVDPQQEYLVGTADMFTFGTGYLSLKEGRDPRYWLPEFLRDILERELNDRQALEECQVPRFST